MRSYDALVIGGGIIGASAFRYPRKRCASTLDPQQPGREGFLGGRWHALARARNRADIPLIPFSRASLALYPAFLADMKNLGRGTSSAVAKARSKLFFSAATPARIEHSDRSARGLACLPSLCLSTKL